MARLLILFLLLAAPAHAELASLRPLAVVEDGVVRLGDLFENAGPRAATVLGPAPAPGARTVVEASQLQAIARANGIAWRPLGGTERVVVERPGRALGQDEVILALRASLRPQGLDDDSELDIAGFTSPLVPERAFVQLAVESAVLDAVGGRFVATLAIVAEGMPTLRQRLAGRVVQTTPMLVAARRLPAGEVLRAQDVRVVRVAAGRLRAGVAQDADAAVGHALRRPVQAEQPLMLADIAQAMAVERGQTVTMLYEVTGMSLTAQGRAMEAAPRGALVPVMNLTSRAVVQAQVVARGRVRVGASP